MNYATTYSVGIFIVVSNLLTSCRREQASEIVQSDNGKLAIFGTKIYYEEYGKGVPLIMLSGGGLNRSTKDFAKCIPELSKHYRVIVPDAPGQGLSDQPDTLTYDLLARFYATFIDSLNLDSTYVIGWSDGGIAGILLAATKGDKVKRVIAYGANNGLTNVFPPEVDIDEVKPLPLDEWAKFNKDVIEAYCKIHPAGWKKHQASLNAMWYAREYFPKSLYDSIHIPVLIAQGDHDFMIPEHAVELHRRIKNSQLCILPNTTHEVFSEKPELINKIALGFFTESSAKASE